MQYVCRDPKKMVHQKNFFWLSSSSKYILYKPPCMLNTDRSCFAINHLCYFLIFKRSEHKWNDNKMGFDIYFLGSYLWGEREREKKWSEIVHIVSEMRWYWFFSSDYIKNIHNMYSSVVFVDGYFVCIDSRCVRGWISWTWFLIHFCCDLFHRPMKKKHIKIKFFLQSIYRQPQSFHHEKKVKTSRSKQHEYMKLRARQTKIWNENSNKTEKALDQIMFVDIEKRVESNKKRKKRWKITRDEKKMKSFKSNYNSRWIQI